jgi:PAS domain S-box-containing protein
MSVEKALAPLPEQVADAIPALMSYIDADLRYRFVNRAYTAWFGHDRTDIEHHHMADVLGEAAFEALRPHVEGVLRGEEQRFEAVIPYREGGPRRVECCYLPDAGADGKVRGFYVLVVDHTKADLHSRRIAEILDGFGEAFAAFDFDWRVRHANRAAERHFGFRREDALGHVIWDLVPGRGGRLHAFLTDAMASREPADAEIPSDILPGHWLAMRAFPLETGLGVSFRDVTARRERLRSEREQAERLELALAAAGLGDWSWSAETNHFTLSPTAAAVWGISPDEGLSWETMAECVHPEDRERVGEAFAAAIAERSSYEIEHRIVRPITGEVRWALVRARAEVDDTGRPVRILGVIGDVTERRSEAARALADRERLAQLEHRRAFLLEVSDTLIAIEEPEAILAAASRLLGERLGASRVGYAEIADDNDTAVVRGEWTSPGTPPLANLQFSLGVYGDVAASVARDGVPVRINDVALDARSSGSEAAHEAVHARAVLTVPLVRNGRYDAMLFVNDREPRAWTDEDVALAIDVAARTWSSLTRARSERALRESEARFRAMADTAPSPVWVTSAAGGVEFVNRAFCEFTGKTYEDLLGDTWIASLMHPEDVERIAAQRAQARGQERPPPYAFEARFRGAAGEWRWMRAAAQPRFDDSGVFQGYVGLAVDVTEQRRADERQRLLINELNHRVKNTLATVQSLAHQTLREGVPTREGRQRLTDRLLALSAAHNVLTQENWEAADVADIVREAMRPYDVVRPPRIRAQGPPVRVAPNVALALSMALHELATNAVKYGALSVDEGRVSLTWAVSEGRLHVTWRETGGPPVVKPSATGFGSRLLIHGLAAELRAPAEILYEPSGLVCHLTAPVA